MIKSKPNSRFSREKHALNDDTNDSEEDPSSQSSTFGNSILPSDSSSSESEKERGQGKKDQETERT